MNYPSWEIYETLYARYLTRSVTEMIDAAGGVEGKKVVDLCGGTGRLAEECVKQKAGGVCLVDACPEMWGRLRGIDNCPVEIFSESVQLFLSRCVRQFDVVFCRQAVNYWLNDEIMQPLVRRVRKGGVFVFNTFNTQPSSDPMVKQYEMCDPPRKYVEVSSFHPETQVVYHSQSCTGLPMHTTSFKWISPEDFHTLLSPHFDISVIRDGKTSMYLCEKHGRGNG